MSRLEWLAPLSTENQELSIKVGLGLDWEINRSASPLITLR